MEKKFSNTNDSFKSNVILTHSGIEVNVSTATTYSTDSKGNPIKAIDDVVYVSLFNNNSETELHVYLKKEHTLELIAALATAASKLRDKIE